MRNSDLLELDRIWLTIYFPSRWFRIVSKGENRKMEFHFIESRTAFPSNREYLLLMELYRSIGENWSLRTFHILRCDRLNFYFRIFFFCWSESFKLVREKELHDVTRRSLHCIVWSYDYIALIYNYMMIICIWSLIYLISVLT